MKGNKHCPMIEFCPIFQENVLIKGTDKTYKNLYCLDPSKYLECKRYLASRKTKKKIPTRIMPNTLLNVEEIIEKLDGR